MSLRKIIKNVVKDIVKMLFPIFNGYISLMGIYGIYIFCGGKPNDKVGFMFVPLIVALIYGVIVGFRAVEYKR